MKNFLKVLTIAVILGTAALFVLGCNNPAGGDPTGDPVESPDNTDLVDKLVDHFNSTTVDVIVGTIYMVWPGFGAFPIGQGVFSPALGIPTYNADGSQNPSPLSGLVSGIDFTGTLTYTANANSDSGGPYLIYELGGKDPQTLDPVTFTSIDAARLVTVIKDSLGGITDGFAYIEPSYGYLGDDLTASITEYPDAGKIKILIPLIQDPDADQTKPAVSGVTGVSISETSVVTITGADTVAGTYESASKTLTVTVPASGITKGGAGGIAAAFVSAITGKITNNKDLGYARPLSASGVVDGANVVISVNLGTTVIQAAALVGAINGIGTGDVDISGTSASGGFITGLADIPGVTADVTAAYKRADHVLTFTLSAPAGYEFDPAADYNAAGNALGGKIAITTTDDGNYTGAASTPATVIDGNLVITAILKAVIINPDALSSIVEAINGAADGDLTGAYNMSYQLEFTGALITALADIPDVTGSVTVAAITNAMYQTTGISVTLAPAAGYSFSADPDACDEAAAALDGKIGTVSIPGFGGPPTLMGANGTQAALTGGNLVFTVSLVNQ